MINKKLQSVEWAAFMYELEDAREHLENLIKDLKENPDYGDPELRIDLGHVFAHLNRAWRRSGRDLNDTEWEWASKFPDDLTPVG
ncbi:hypothetical protein GCM10010981_18220 [Dyella nitratireducens]|uniref:Uncharacterized protein n=1 Tax=Dyella nitratireducens TaxID=1849580 RepID=A0ABQ1FU07_9GAMM|nr:hypothetical protein GCM10010981_18220 [Dyella nitratireducens]GLQ43114.1 hypothetical protein GCM10007902_29640 [Dyella nitratireducens]